MALQLNDRLLSDSMTITRHLRSALPHCTFCIVADSTYGERDIDEISARHLGCQRIIFFGDFNMKMNTTTNAFFVRLEHYTLDKIITKVDELVNGFDNDNYIVVSANGNILAKLEHKTSLLDLNWTEKKEYDYVIYIGNQKDDKIVAWCMQNQPKQLIAINPITAEAKVNPFDTGRLLMQRFHLIEKAKGIFVLNFDKKLLNPLFRRRTCGYGTWIKWWSWVKCSLS